MVHLGRHRLRAAVHGAGRDAADGPRGNERAWAIRAATSCTIAAERWGWRYYNEGIGMNTFSPVIEYENDAEIEAALLKEAERSLNSADLTSAAFVLGSVGEEAGFKHGWGTRYYWDTPIAPDKACRAFQWFLRDKVPGGGRFERGLEDQLRGLGRRAADPRVLRPGARAGSRRLGAPQGLAAGRRRDGGQPVALCRHGRILQLVLRPHRRHRAADLPRADQPGDAGHVVGADHRLRRIRRAAGGPGAWNESQWHSIADGPEPGFGLIWGHFDWSVKTDNMFWGFLLMRSGHNNYWVDVPLMFNNDLTHTRSSFAMRQWTQRLAGHERIILDSRPAPSDVGLLGPNGVGLDNTRGNMATSLQVALSQAGFGLPASDPAKLDACKIVFAIGRQAVSLPGGGASAAIRGWRRHAGLHAAVRQPDGSDGVAQPVGSRAATWPSSGNSG